MHSREALDEFLEIIRNADQTFLDPDKALDDQGKVDGYQHLFHLLETAIEFYLHNDPLHPQLMLLADQNRKLLGDNVDAVYYFTQVRGDQEYVIKGQRFDSCYFSISLYGGDPHGELADRVSLNINHRDIKFEDDGSFLIKLTPNPKGENEFRIDEDSVTLFTREYFFDRPSSRESELEISLVDPIATPVPLTDEQLARRIRTMAMFFQCTTWLAPLPVEFPINEFMDPFEYDAEQGGWGTVDNIYCFARFRLQENEYLKITFQPTEACYWGFQTWNFFMQSTNYRDYPVCLNNGTSEPESDGSYAIYLSHRPMEKNWISTAGYNEGIVFTRWLLAEEMPNKPQIEVLAHPSQ